MSCVAGAGAGAALAGASSSSGGAGLGAAAGPCGLGEGGDALEEAISVSVRIRPLNGKELKAGWRDVWHAQDGKSVYSSGDALGGQHTFDNVFDPDASTQQVYDKVAREMVSSVLCGLNGTVFAYGQTASGKTFTMQGEPQSPGVLGLAAGQVFREIAEQPRAQFLLHVSYIEVFNEQIKDLLSDTDQSLRIREDRDKGFFVDGLVMKSVTSVEDLLACKEEGERRRHVGETNMNARSSRSHTIFTLTVEARRQSQSQSQTCEEEAASVKRRLSGDSAASSVAGEGEQYGGVLVGKLNLVDLAGSENARATGAEGSRLKEGANINKSLLTLSRVISQLAVGKGKAGGFINWRDSKLTQILQPSLAGNCRTAIVCCITPASKYMEETKSTLQFAKSAKQIRTRVIVNEVLDGEGEMRKLKRTIHELRSELASQHELNAEKSVLENKIKMLSALLLQGGAAVMGRHDGPGAAGPGAEAGLANSAEPPRAKRHKKKHRETWGPGQFKEQPEPQAHEEQLPALAEEGEEEAAEPQPGAGASSASRSSAGSATALLLGPTGERLREQGLPARAAHHPQEDPQPLFAAERIEALTAKVRAREATLAAATARAAELEDQLSEAAERVAERTAAAAEAAAEAASTRERLGALLEQRAVEAVDLLERAAGLEQALARAERARAEAVREVLQLREDERALVEQVAAAQARLAAANAEQCVALESEKAARRALEADVATARAQAAEAAAKLSSAEKRGAAEAGEADALARAAQQLAERERADNAAKLAALEESLVVAEMERGDLLRKVAESGAARAAAEQRAADADVECRTLRDEVGSHRAEAAAAVVQAVADAEVARAALAKQEALLSDAQCALADLTAAAAAEREAADEQLRSRLEQSVAHHADERAKLEQLIAAASADRDRETAHRARLDELLAAAEEELGAVTAMAEQAVAAAARSAAESGLAAVRNEAAAKAAAELSRLVNQAGIVEATLRADLAAAAISLAEERSKAGAAVAEAEVAQAEVDTARTETEAALTEAEAARAEAAAARAEVAAALAESHVARVEAAASRTEVEAARTEAAEARAEADAARVEAEATRAETAAARNGFETRLAVELDRVAVESAAVEAALRAEIAQERANAENLVASASVLQERVAELERLLSAATQAVSAHADGIQVRNCVDQVVDAVERDAASAKAAADEAQLVVARTRVEELQAAVAAERDAAARANAEAEHLRVTLAEAAAAAAASANTTNVSLLTPSMRFGHDDADGKRVQQLELRADLAAQERDRAIAKLLEAQAEVRDVICRAEGAEREWAARFEAAGVELAAAQSVAGRAEARLLELAAAQRQSEASASALALELQVARADLAGSASAAEADAAAALTTASGRWAEHEEALRGAVAALERKVAVLKAELADKDVLVLQLNSAVTQLEGAVVELRGGREAAEQQELLALRSELRVTSAELAAAKREVAMFSERLSCALSERDAHMAAAAAVAANTGESRGAAEARARAEELAAELANKLGKQQAACKLLQEELERERSQVPSLKQRLARAEEQRAAEVGALEEAAIRAEEQLQAKKKLVTTLQSELAAAAAAAEQAAETADVEQRRLARAVAESAEERVAAHRRLTESEAALAIARERIEKLEKVKITREQAEKINKLREEHRNLKLRYAEVAASNETLVRSQAELQSKVAAQPPAAAPEPALEAQALAEQVRRVARSFGIIDPPAPPAFVAMLAERLRELQKEREQVEQQVRELDLAHEEASEECASLRQQLAAAAKQLQAGQPAAAAQTAWRDEESRLRGHVAQLKEEGLKLRARLGEFDADLAKLREEEAERRAALAAQLDEQRTSVRFLEKENLDLIVELRKLRDRGTHALLTAQPDSSSSASSSGLAPAPGTPGKRPLAGVEPNAAAARALQASAGASKARAAPGWGEVSDKENAAAAPVAPTTAPRVAPKKDNKAPVPGADGVGECQTQ